MDNSDYFGNRHDDRLGVNKFGKSIRKSPPHQPNFGNQTRQPPQPQVYNINKNDFRNIVQQLTGSPSRQSQEQVLRPPQNSPAMRLQKNRPPGLAPINVNRPQMPPRGTIPMPMPMPYNNNLQYGQPPPPTAATAESPISAYMRYLQHSIVDPTQRPPLLPSPRIIHGPFIPPSPTFMPSPSGYLNLLSPLSPYPLLSPGYQRSPPNFTFSPMAQSGILGPGPQLPPPSPGMGFPSPGFFQISSPRWRN